MRNRSKLLLTAIATTLIMAAAVTVASARQFTTSNQNARAVWTSIQFTSLGGLIQIRCNLTLRASFHYRTFSKTRSLVGYITSAGITRPCSGGEAWVLNGSERPTNTLPWHIVYDSFRGTLPRITGIRLGIIGGSFLLSGLGNQCQYTGTAPSPAFGIINLNESTGEGISLSADSTVTVPLAATLVGSCPANGAFAGTTSLLDEGEGSRITIRLI